MRGGLNIVLTECTFEYLQIVILERLYAAMRH
jgi:hypothetical protein